MFSTSSFRGATLLVAACMLAACGSDKAAGPTTANNDQIISEMTAALQSSGDSMHFEQVIALQAAIVGLSIGAPVTPGNVILDGTSYHFSTTAISLEEHDSASGDVVMRATLVVGWRQTDGDSLFLAAYAPDGGGVFGDRRAPGALLQRSGRSALGMAEIGRMLRSGNVTVSRTPTLGADAPSFIALVADGKLWEADSQDGIVSGSISYSATAGECDLSAADSEEVFIGGDVGDCSMQRSNVALQANTRDAYSSEEVQPAGPDITIPAQSVSGVKLVLDFSAPA